MGQAAKASIEPMVSAALLSRATVLRASRSPRMANRARLTVEEPTAQAPALLTSLPVIMMPGSAFCSAVRSSKLA